MDPLTLLGTTALSGGLSFISGASQSRTTKAQNRINIWLAQQANEKSEQIGKNLYSLPMFDPVAFAEAGDALGFNRVTWLNSGAAQIFQPRAQAEAAYRMMLPTATAQVARVPSMAEAAANAGLSALNTFTAGYKTMTSQNMQWDMLERQISAMAGRTSGLAGGSAGSFGVSNPFQPNAYGVSAGGVASYGGALSPKSGPVSDLPYPGKWETGKVEVTNPGRASFIDHNISNTEMKETRAGEPGDWLFGFDTLFHDAVRNVTGRTIRDWGLASGMSLDQYHRGSNSIAQTLGRWYADPNGFFNFGSRTTSRRAPVVPYMPFAGANAY